MDDSTQVAVALSVLLVLVVLPLTARWFARRKR